MWGGGVGRRRLLCGDGEENAFIFLSQRGGHLAVVCKYSATNRSTQRQYTGFLNERPVWRWLPEIEIGDAALVHLYPTPSLVGSLSSCDSGIPSFRSWVPGFLPSCPSIVFDLCRSKERRKRTIRCGPHRVVNELRRTDGERRTEKCSFDRHFTRHSDFLSPPPFSALNTFAARSVSFPAAAVQSTPRSRYDLPYFDSPLHMLPHHRSRKLPRKQRGTPTTPTTAARSSSFARHNQFRSIDRRRDGARGNSGKEGVLHSCEQNMARLSSHALLSSPSLSSQSVSPSRRYVF